MRRINYYVGKMPEGEVTLQILDESGEVLRTFKGTPGEEADSVASGPRGRREPKLPVAEGFNTVMWNLRGEALETDIHLHLLEDEKGAEHVDRHTRTGGGSRQVPRFVSRSATGSRPKPCKSRSFPT